MLQWRLWSIRDRNNCASDTITTSFTIERNGATMLSFSYFQTAPRIVYIFFKSIRNERENATDVYCIRVVLICYLISFHSASRIMHVYRPNLYFARMSHRWQEVNSQTYGKWNIYGRSTHKLKTTGWFTWNFHVVHVRFLCTT